MGKTKTFFCERFVFILIPCWLFTGTENRDLPTEAESQRLTRLWVSTLKWTPVVSTSLKTTDFSTLQVMYASLSQD